MHALLLTIVRDETSRTEPASDSGHLKRTDVERFQKALPQIFAHDRPNFYFCFIGSNMDSEDSLPEKGTPLPLPKNIDCHVGAMEGPYQGSLEPPDGDDVENFDHSHSGSPPRDTETGEPDVIGGEEDFFGLDGYSPLGGCSVVREEPAEEEGELN